MGKKYYEVVFEGNYDIICGMIEGFLLAKREKWELHLPLMMEKSLQSSM